jgi:hypothetical protein
MESPRIHSIDSWQILHQLRAVEKCPRYLAADLSSFGQLYLFANYDEESNRVVSFHDDVF